VYFLLFYRQVRKNYYRSEPNEVEDALPPPPPIARRAIRQAAMVVPPTASPTESSAPVSLSPGMDQNIDEVGGPGRRQVAGRKSFYRCKFCGLTTHVRTDMRHHLMREIGYKPFRCGHCYAAGAGYAEPSRSAMGKHFRMRHAGMTVDVHDLSDPAKEAEVFDLLDSSMVAEDGMESDAAQPVPMVGGGAIKRMQSAVTGQRLPSLRSSHVGTVTEGVYRNCEAAAVAPFRESMSVVPNRPTAGSSISSTLTSPKRRARIGAMHLRRCQHCSYTTKSPKALAQHIAVRHRPRGLRCAYCEHTAHYPSWLRKHAQKSHPNMPFRFLQIGGGAARNGEVFVEPPGSAPEVLPPSMGQDLSEPWTDEPDMSFGGSESG
jgi:hypothetical protein